MKKIFSILAIFLLLPNLAFADPKGAVCGVQGDGDFTIAFNVWGGNSGHSVGLDQGSHGYVLWYTDPNEIPTNYASSLYERVFYESKLDPALFYNILITHDTSEDVLNYYRKLDSELESSYVLIDTRKLDLKTGKHWVLGGDVDITRCSSQVEPPPLPLICSYFPEPIQGWKGSTSTLNIQNPTQISGWSSEYLNDDTNIYSYQQNWPEGASWDNLRVGFDKGFNKWWLYEIPSASSCNGYGCFPADGVSGDGFSVGNDGLVESRKAETPTKITPNFGSSSLYISPDKNDAGIVTEEFCNNNPRICSYGSSSSGLKEPLITVLSSLKNLTINNHKDTFDKLTVVIADGVQIESVNIPRGDNVIFQTLDNSTVTFGNWKEDTGATVYSFGNNSRINIVNSFNMANKMKVANTNSVTLYAPEGDIDFSTTNDEFYGFILGKTVSFSNPITVHGAVTSQYLTIDTINVVIQRPSYDCSSNIVEDDYTLILTPESNIALVCEDITPTVSVMENGKLASDFNGKVVVSVDGVEQRYSGPSEKFSIESGEENKVVSVSAYIEGDQDDTLVTGSYEFVPFKFSADDQYVVAGKSKAVKVKTLACDDNGEVVDVDNGYNGTLTSTSSWIVPASGSKGNVTFAPKFVDGTAKSEFVVDESGKIKVSLEDSNFDCTGIEGCPIEGSGTLKGQFTVYSRPWTFAICSTDNTNLDDATGDSNSGNGFIAAGETFDAKVLPLRYTDSGSISGEVESTSSLCGQGDVTSNFFLGDSSDNTVVLSSSVETPTQSDDLVFSSEISRKNSDNEYTFTDLSWEDVGSLKLMAATSDNSSCASGGTLQTWYECTQMGYREVGRFYPAYFEVTQSDWWVDKADAEDTATEPYSQNNIAYLSQPFGLAEFEVVPFSLNGSAIENYSQFVASLQAKISVLEDEDLGDRLTVSVSDGDWDNDSTHSRWYLEDQYAVFYRDFTLDTQGVRESNVDGPFNVSEDANSTTTNFGFTISTNSDPIDSRTQNDTACLNNTESYSSVCDLSFPTQPPARYGRMAMDDVGGTSVSTINIPLRTEYWNGSRFITNTDDSASDYSSDEDYVCYQEVWSEASGSDGSLKAVTKTVDSGVSDELYATPYSADDSSSIRQQIRFWLRMDDTSTTSPQTLETDDVTCGSSYMSQPWLQYNWRGKGDEDPSSVVTFGIHRGNDRVIYRGEPGLTAQ
ncbi:DUF6701 domain-containing protein [Vibrio sp. EA2]|uniref:DUF6701 domain-containing protein n=1 Tax=Vibrio sp. EA2 TaxID=3079860 RepID=UPI0029494B1D|nr:DUF6701 domain-containing protein [Vibrio sp. EA2]MDV6253641.1 DUF6701 domain-containing protein [Vibrio sp. EA2]